jgi:Protein of unknown function (DUF3306)
MGELEKFISRWSRRKRASDLENDLRERAAVSAAAVRKVDSGDEAAAKHGDAQMLDLAALPSLESINAATDIRGFLQSAVPVELTRAALRRAWVSDPHIRDFVGIAENQWDFTNPTTIPGFGPLPQAADKVAEPMGAIDRSLGRLSAARPPRPTPVESASQVSDSRCDSASEGQSTLATSTADDEVPISASANSRSEEATTRNFSRESADTGRPRRAHGGALPR